MRARRKDRNQAEIERGLRCHPGVYVFDTSAVGGGYPDLNVGYQGRTYMFEVKDPPTTTQQAANDAGRGEICHALYRAVCGDPYA